MESDGPPLLTVRDLVKRFDGVTAVAGANLETRDREILGVIGANGSGKTTLVNCVSGVLPATEGRITFDGTDITGWSRPRRARAGLLRTFQNLRLFAEMTVSENVQAGASTGRGSSGGAAIVALLDELDLTAHARRRVADLPYGAQRRVEIARALAGGPRLLLLDEPAAGLTTADREHLSEVLRAQRNQSGTAILVIDHNMTFMRGLCDRIVAFRDGRDIFSGAPGDVLSHPDVVESYLGTPMEAGSA